MAYSVRNRIYRPRDLKALGIDYTDQHLRRLEAKGKFPQRRKLVQGSGPRGAIGWLSDEIHEWIENLRTLAAALIVTVGAALTAVADYVSGFVDTLI